MNGCDCGRYVNGQPVPCKRHPLRWRIEAAQRPAHDPESDARAPWLRNATFRRDGTVAR